MAGWEEELAVLLRELGVKQEEPKTRSRQARKPMHSDVKQPEQYADALFWSSMEEKRSGENARNTDHVTESDDADDDVWLNDLSMMRREVDAIVSQVIRLMQRGDLDISLKEDVMVVLRALRRRAAVTQQAAAGDEAYLESASAMLHFCRLVLQLSEVATEE